MAHRTKIVTPSWVLKVPNCCGPAGKPLDGPSWINEACYDLAAKLPPGATRDDVRLMVQNLLADRFHLAAHRETRTIPTYTLVVVPGGPKLKRSEIQPASSGPSAEKPTAGPPWAVRDCRIRRGCSRAVSGVLLGCQGALDRPGQLAVVWAFCASPRPRSGVAVVGRERPRAFMSVIVGHGTMYTGFLFSGSRIMVFKEKTRYSFLQLFGGMAFRYRQYFLVHP